LNLDDGRTESPHAHELEKASEMAKTGRVFETTFEIYTAVEQVGWVADTF